VLRFDSGGRFIAQMRCTATSLRCPGLSQALKNKKSDEFLWVLLGKVADVQ